MNTPDRRGTAAGVALSALERDRTAADQPAPVATATLHTRFEREAIPLMDSLLGGAIRLTGNRHDAEDLLQETMLLAYNGFGSFREGTNLPAWMFRIMRNAWISRYHKKRRRPPEVLVDYVTLQSLAPTASQVRRSTCSAEVAALERILDDRLRNALMALREEFRVAVYYADLQGYCYKDIARVTGTPVGTVMSRVSRGRQLLRKSLAAAAAE